jgi:hypothetical protein
LESGEATIEGRQPAELTASALSQRLDLPAPETSTGKGRPGLFVT